MFEHLKVWVNGKIIPWEQATVHIMSHSFSRGSAMFDVFGIHQSPTGPVAFRMDKHLDRLFRSAQLLGFEMAYTKDDVTKAVAKLVKENNIRRGLVKILAYYSEEAVLSLVMDSKLDLAVFAIPETDELGLDKAEPISICISKWRKLHPATVPVEAKACANYLNGVLSRKDAAERGFDLAIMLTTDGYVAEGAIESVFMVKDGVVKTPALGNILQSITRMSILEAAPAIGLETSEEQITREEFMAADEIFTCHTGIKVTPVKKIEDRVFGQAPGPVSSRISKLMEDICHFRDGRFKDWMQPI
ncbi:MAG: aminotransferase class IV [Desulfatiglandaceae bacterium]|jgi:branched-chain amino acid aminotransferase